MAVPRQCDNVSEAVSLSWLGSGISQLRDLSSRIPADLVPTTATLLLRTAEKITLGAFETLANKASCGYAAFDDLLELASRHGVAAYATDADGFFHRYNDQAVSLWGWAPPIGTQRWVGAWKMPCPLEETPLARALRERRIVHPDTVIGWRPDGDWIATRPLAIPVRSSKAGVLGGINILLNVRSRVAIERRHDLPVAPDVRLVGTDGKPSQPDHA